MNPINEINFTHKCQENWNYHFLIWQLPVECGYTKLLTFLGIYSLEMYLFHEKVLWLLSFYKKIVIIDKYDIILNVFAYIVSMIIAFVWSKIVALIVDKYNS